MYVNCSPSNSIFETIPFIVYSCHSIVFVGIPIHFFGLYCVIAKTPAVVKSVRSAMILSCVCVFYLDITFGVLTIPFVITPAPAGFPLGLLQHLGVPIPLQLNLTFHGVMCDSRFAIKQLFHCTFCLQKMSVILKFFTAFHIIVGSLGMTFNLLLIYLALFQTPKIINSYSTLIVNFAITDFSACFFDVFVQQRLIPIGRSLIHVSNGFCKYISPAACYVGHSIELHLFSHTLWSLFLSFSYRYFILFHFTPKRLTLILVILLFYLPSFIQCIVFLWTEDDEGEIFQIVHDRFPDYNFDGMVVTGVKDIICFSVLATILHMTLPVTPVYICILTLRRRIINRLGEQTSKMTEKTRRLHNQLLMALTYQALIPGFYTVAVASYTIGQLGIYNHPILEYLVFAALLCIPCLSPISSFVFVTPYRTYIKGLFSRKNAKAEATTSNNFSHSINVVS